MAVTRRDLGADDTFTLPEETQRAIVTETVRIMRRAALERAITVARRAAKKRRATCMFQESPTADREYVRALETALTAAETYLGMNETEED